MAEVLYEVDGGIARLTLNRPEKLNAMTRQMYGEISGFLVDAENDPNVRCVIVAGEGRAFTSGHDLGELSTRDGEQGWQPYRPRRFDNGLACSKPTIAAISGYCLAGGLELALFCDIRIASEDAQFATPEAKWGILHGYGALRLPDMVGMSNALYMLLSGEFIDASAALRMGLVSHVVPREETRATAERIARAICANGPIAVRMVKELAYRGRDMPLVDGLRLYQEFGKTVFRSEDAAEGTRAFVERRQPAFQGR